MEIPTELFKYRCFEKYTILSLLNKELWLPKPSELNDPFDAQLKLNDTEVTIQEYEKAHKLYLHWYFEKYKKNNESNIDELFKNNRLTSSAKRRMETFQNFWNSQCESYGVYSLSETPHSNTMWSHYADSHKGICIGYEPLKLFQQSLDNKSIEPRKVTYKKEEEISRNAYLLMAQAGSVLDVDAYTDLFIKMLSTKSDDWQYEMEWRFTIPDEGGRILSFDIDAITSITFGLRTSKETKESITNILMSYQNEIDFFQMKRDENVARLIREPLISEDNKYWHCSYE